MENRLTEKGGTEMAQTAGERSMLQYIKDRARELLWSLDGCPEEKVRPSNQLLPILEFTNGMCHPMAATRPPFAVYFEYQGSTWTVKAGGFYQQTNHNGYNTISWTASAEL